MGLPVLRFDGRRKRRYVPVECECGKRVEVLIDTLASGESTQCARCSRRRKHDIPLLTRFGHLVVVGAAEWLPWQHFQTSFECRCDCGQHVQVLGTRLRNGYKTACARCLRSAVSKPLPG
jgi:hypothetical protein